MIPGEVLALIEEAPRTELPGITTDQHECAGSKFHSPRPMVVHPFPMPHAPGELTYLCGTCLDNIRVLLALQEQGEVPWTVKRCFGNGIRAVATTTKENDRA